MKTWKELADETTAENVATNLELARALGTEDMIRFVSRTVRRDMSIIKTSTIKEWIKTDGNYLVTEPGEYRHVMTDPAINEGLEDRTYFALIRNSEHQFRSIQLSAFSNADAYRQVLKVRGYDNDRHLIIEVVKATPILDGVEQTIYNDLMEF